MVTIKTGRKTTEFLVTLGVIAVLVGAGASALATLPGKWGAVAASVAAVAASIASAAYSLGRSQVKAAAVAAAGTSAAAAKIQPSA